MHNASSTLRKEIHEGMRNASSTLGKEIHEGMHNASSTLGETMGKEQRRGLEAIAASLVIGLVVGNIGSAAIEKDVNPWMIISGSAAIIVIAVIVLQKSSPASRSE